MPFPADSLRQLVLVPELGLEAIPLQNVSERMWRATSMAFPCTDLTVLCFSPSFPAFSLLPSVQQASCAAASFSSVSYCVQQTKVAFTPEDGSAAQGLSVSVSHSFLSRHGSLPVPSVSCSLLFLTWKHVNRALPW